MRSTCKKYEILSGTPAGVDAVPISASQAVVDYVRSFG